MIFHYCRTLIVVIGIILNTFLSLCKGILISLDFINSYKKKTYDK